MKSIRCSFIKTHKSHIYCVVLLFYQLLQTLKLHRFISLTTRSCHLIIEIYRNICRVRSSMPRFKCVRLSDYRTPNGKRMKRRQSTMERSIAVVKQSVLYKGRTCISAREPNFIFGLLQPQLHNFSSDLSMSEITWHVLFFGETEVPSIYRTWSFCYSSSQYI